MKPKIKKFKKIAKENKPLLVKSGIKNSTVRSWIYTSRVPSEENAKKISMILGIPLSEIPFYRIERFV